MDKLSEHAIRMLEIEGKGKNDGYIETRNMGDIARAVYDLILQVQMLKTELLHKTEPKIPTHGYMWICPKCGLEMHSDYSACHRCGWDRSKPKTEPQTDNGIGCSRCEGRYDCLDRDMPHAVHCNNFGKITDEPQSEPSRVQAVPKMEDEEYINNLPWVESGNGEQTDCAWGRGEE